MMKKKWIAAISTACLCLMPFAGVQAKAADDAVMADRDVKMYRLYNPNSGEHFYTSSSSERKDVIEDGWTDEGVGWYAPISSDTPVYRLYNPNGQEHHYTMNKSERDMLENAGWIYEGVGWYSDDEETIPVYRQYNPNEMANNHNYTTSVSEKDFLISEGWKNEDIGWYGVDDEKVNSTKAKMVAYAETLVGKPYSMDTSLRCGPDYFDCAGFVDYVFAQTGLDENMLAERYWTDPMNTYLLSQVENSSTDIEWSTFDTTDDDDIEMGDIVLYADSEENAEAGHFYHAAIGVSQGVVISALNEESGVVISPVDFTYMRIFRMTNQ